MKNSHEQYVSLIEAARSALCVPQSFFQVNVMQNCHPGMKIGPINYKEMVEDAINRCDADIFAKQIFLDLCWCRDDDGRWYFRYPLENEIFVVDGTDMVCDVCQIEQPEADKTEEMPDGTGEDFCEACQIHLPE